MSPESKRKRRTTQTEFAAVGGDFRRVSLAYAVNLVVVPEVTASAGEFHLAIQALDPVTRNVLWSGSFNGSRSHYLETMNDAGEALRNAIRPASSGASPRPATGSETELAFREGEYHLDRFRVHHEPADFDASIKALQHALELDPKLADAAADIAHLHGLREPADAGEIEKWARRAIEIDAKCGRGYFMLASVTKALNDSLRAAAFAPEYALAQLGLGQALASSTSLAFAASRQARLLDPLYLYAPLAEAGYLHQLGRTSEAFAILDRQVVGINPEMSYGRWTETSLMIELGWLDRADPSFKDIDKELAKQPPMPYALGEIRRVPTLAKNGYIDDSYAILNRAVEGGAPIPYDWLVQDRRLDRLRRDDRYFRVHEYAKDRYESMLKTLDEASSRGELPAYLDQPIADLRSQIRN